MPEVQGTIKHMSKTGKGFVLDQYEQWFNRGAKFEGTWPTQRGEAITVTYEQTHDAEGMPKFWVLEAWPTSTGKPAASAQVAPGPKPTAGPAPTNGPTPTQPEPAGPTPTPPNREQSILFQVCLKAAQEWVLAVEALAKTPAEVLSVADLYYAQGLKLINGEGLALGNGDPGPEEPA